MNRPATVRRGLHPTARPFTSSPLPPKRAARCHALLGLDKLFKGSSAAPQPQPPPLLDPDAPELEPEFQSWLRREGLPTQPLLLRQCGREGRGLVAARPLPRGETLLQVPDSLLITAERAAEESCLAPLLRNLPTATSSTATATPSSSSSSAAPSSPPAPLPLPEWSLMALLLAELRGRLAAGDISSRWSPYVAVLPQRPGTVLDWPAKEAKQLLRGSPLLRLADSITAAAAASWQELEPIISRGRAEGLVPDHVPLAKADLDWAFGVLLSRCIRLPGRADMQVLAPWADLLNHDVAAEAGCHLDWDEGAGAGPRGSGSGSGAGRGGALVLRADRQYAAGQQVYVSYGPKSSGELLLSYGFCPPPAANPHQDYKLKLAVDQRNDPLAELKVQALARHGLPPELEFPLKLEGLPEGLLQYLALLEARPKVAQETFDLASLLFEGGSFPLLDGEDTLVLALRGLSGRCAAAIKEYPTSLEVDQALAAGAVAAVTNRPPRGPRRAPASATTAPAAPATTTNADPSSPASLPTLGTEDVCVSSLRAAAVAGIRVRERQILQRTQAAAAGQLAEVKRAAREARARRR
ncbi:hypothetical protein PLESTB_000905100 [Pleodorina starrii]|uniref:SET domain-containing protein n=1 Tax=Pleodorina starrii TaxID=330485 RepID=A0A9W6F3F7_9CHLO|nr:hypothetical protein PLESTB_000905100 [Pleodorina starrii]GLC68384.1 hypothetical protein PLESTF_000685300 [Pleodorina starrii]